jgi:O-methyltransferase
MADEYLELLKGALTHTLYGHADRGIHYRRNLPARALFAMLRRRDIVPIRVGKTAASDRAEGRDWPVFAQTMVGRARLDNLEWCIGEVLRNGVPGDLIETGVWRGGASIFMKAVLRAHGADGRVVWLCDSFEGLPAPDPRFPADSGATWHSFDVLGVDIDEVKANFERYGLLDDDVRFVKGWFRDTLPKLHDQRWALIRLDADMYESTTDALTHLYPNLSPGGFLVVDDYNVDACRQAVHDYRDAHSVTEPMQRIDWAGVYWRRGETDASGS